MSSTRHYGSDPEVPAIEAVHYDAWCKEHVPDLTGKTYIVTGGNTGLGYWTVRALAAKQATVVIACRDLEKGEAAKRAIAEDIRRDGALASDDALQVMKLDLASFASVREFSAAFRAAHTRLSRSLAAW